MHEIICTGEKTSLRFVYRYNMAIQKGRLQYIPPVENRLLMKLFSILSAVLVNPKALLYANIYSYTLGIKNIPIRTARQIVLFIDVRI